MDTQTYEQLRLTEARDIRRPALSFWARTMRILTL